MKEIKNIYATKGNPNIPNKWDVLLVANKKYVVISKTEYKEDDDMIEIHLKSLTWFWIIVLWLKKFLP